MKKSNKFNSGANSHYGQWVDAVIAGYGKRN